MSRSYRKPIITDGYGTKRRRLAHRKMQIVTEYLQSQFLVQEAVRQPNWNQAVADTGSSQGNAYADPADGSSWTELILR